MADVARSPHLAGVGLFYVGHRLGHAVSSERWLRKRVDWLVQQHGFPHHLPSPRQNERIYNRRAVDAWFDSRLDGDSGGAMNAADRNVWATILDARAAGINALGASA